MPARGHTVSVMSREVSSRSSRGEQTRLAIVEAALRLFREHGYEATTMRAIAQEAGVATGNAYYYYGSKEELIQEYCARNQADHAAAYRRVLAEETRLGVLPHQDRRDRPVRRGDRRGPDPGPGQPAERPAGTAAAVLDGGRLVLGA